MTHTPGNALSHSYVIKAVNSCGNLTAYGAASATDVVDVTAPTAIGNTLTGVKTATAAYSWGTSASPDVTQYRFYGSSIPSGAFPAGWTLLQTTPTRNWTDPLASVRSYYVVTAVDGCGNESVPN